MSHLFDGLFIIEPKKFNDGRGFFSETYNKNSFKQQTNLDIDFVQDNHSLSADKFVLRGLHFQKPPYTQAKLVRVVRGRIFDVVVDIRKGSPTYMQWQSFELSAKNWKQIFIPAGFAHGFMTLEENTEVVYKVSEFYNPDADTGIAWNDPTINIDWPIPEGQKPLLSEKDTTHPTLDNFETPFTYSRDLEL